MEHFDRFFRMPELASLISPLSILFDNVPTEIQIGRSLIDSSKRLVIYCIKNSEAVIIVTGSDTEIVRII